jgi:hypothetical protein
VETKNGDYQITRVAVSYAAKAVLVPMRYIVGQGWKEDPQTDSSPPIRVAKILARKIFQKIDFIPQSDSSSIATVNLDQPSSSTSALGIHVNTLYKQSSFRPADT